LTIYADSSFLVSLYSQDANSPIAVQTMQASQGDRLLSTLGELEVVNALELRIFRKEITPAQAQSALHDFEKHLREGVFQVREVVDMFFERARQLSRQTTAKFGTRTADLELGADYLYSFDQQQRKLARAVRLKLN
jgi:predicted nucleic acid-binding protein